MTLKYSGPKELISPLGIDFKSGKDDKYVYIYPAMQVYNAIHHDYEKNVVYTHNIEGKRLKDEEILNKILNLKPNLNIEIETEILDFKKILDNEIEEVQDIKNFSQLEKEVYKNNLILMKNYRIQRETNKIIYNQIIKVIVDDIFTHRLKEINTPFNERFWHILQTIQGELSNHEKRSIGSTLDTVHKDTITISLKMNSIGK